MGSERTLIRSGREAAISLYTVAEGERIDSPPVEAQLCTYMARMSQTSLWYGLRSGFSSRCKFWEEFAPGRRQ